MLSEGRSRSETSLIWEAQEMLRFRVPSGCSMTDPKIGGEGERKGRNMLAQSTQETAFTPVQYPLTADRVSKGGRTITVIMFVIVLAALGLMFYWLGARRVNNFWVSRGDTQFQAQ